MHCLSLITFLTLGIATVSAIPARRTTPVNITSVVLQNSYIINSNFPAIATDVAHRLNIALLANYTDATDSTSALNVLESYVSSTILQSLANTLESANEDIRFQYGVQVDARVDEQISLTMVQQQVQTIMQYPFTAVLQARSNLTALYDEDVTLACVEGALDNGANTCDGKSIQWNNGQSACTAATAQTVTIPPSIWATYNQQVNTVVSQASADVMDNLFALVTSVASQAVLFIAQSYCTSSSSTPVADCLSYTIW